MKNNDQHKFTPEQLGAYYDGQLGESERHEIEWHVKTCPRCHAFLADLTLMDKAVERAENVSAPDGYFDTFGSAVANRIARQKLEPQKQDKRFGWGWVTAAAALASLTIILISGDLTKQRFQHPAPEGYVPAPTEIPADLKAKDEAPSEKPGSDKGSLGSNPVDAPQKIKSNITAPGEQAKSMAPSPEPGLAEVPAEKATETGATAKAAETMAAPPQMTMSDISLDKEAPTATPAKRAKDKAAAREAKFERPDDFIGAGLASAPAQAPTQTQAPSVAQVQASAPAPVLARTQASASVPVRAKTPTPPTVTALEQSPAKVDNVTVIVICLPDGNMDCPEPKVTSAIRIRLSGD
jgi:hypothetical protein